MRKLGFKMGTHYFFLTPYGKGISNHRIKNMQRQKVLEHHILALETKFCDIWTNIVQVMAVLRFREIGP